MSTNYILVVVGHIIVAIILYLAEYCQNSTHCVAVKKKEIDEALTSKIQHELHKLAVTMFLNINNGIVNCMCS